jgi:DNA-binding MarR family transcriptional regulator
MNREEVKPYGAEINILSKMFHCAIKHACNKSGINPTFTGVIMHLSDYPEGVNQNQIVEHTKLKAPTISLTLKNMESLGYITRESSCDDKRNIIVKLTKEGEELDKMISECFVEVESRLTKGISQEELDYFKQITQKMKNNLSEEEIK